MYPTRVSDTCIMYLSSRAARRHAQKRQRGRRYQAGLREQEEGRSSTAAAPWKASVQQGPQAQLNKGELDY